MTYVTTLRTVATIDLINLDADGLGSIDIALVAEVADEDGDVIDARSLEEETTVARFVPGPVADGGTVAARELLANEGWEAVGPFEDAGDFGIAVFVEPTTPSTQAIVGRLVRDSAPTPGT